jgi:hypothetical protein
MLGSLTTVSVAWTFALLPAHAASHIFVAERLPDSERPATAFSLLRAQGPGWDRYRTVIHRMAAAHAFPGLGVDVRSGPARRFVPVWARPLVLPWEHQQPWPHETRLLQEVRASGWPWPALYEIHASVGAPSGTLRVWKGGFVARPDSAQQISVPFLPIAGGFAADTAVYGATWWLLLQAPDFTRSRLRRRRGLCERCGYPTPGARCPECGTERRHTSDAPAHA